MEPSNTESELTEDYLRIVERRVELARLMDQARQKKSILVYGPEGVGKTRLLHEFIRTQPLSLYVSQARSPHDLLLSLVNSLRRILGARNLPSDTSKISTSSLKGVVNKALDVKPFLVVLDHVEGPSRIVTKFVKELNYYGRTPIFMGARSPHMEDIGALQPLCADRSERLEVTNWPPAVALEFARHEAERAGLWASNLDAALESIVQSSAGNPGSILQMVKMAHQSQYWRDDQLKFHVLYLDYRMGRR
ncbi:MAG: AAA family ATPase [Acidobacteriaceae bacterium]